MARHSKQMSESRLLAIVDQQISDAKQFAGSDRDTHREWALKFFEGKVDFNAEEGRSKVVSRDVADTHGFILPSLLRVFFASDRVGVYEPTRPHFRAVEERDEDTGEVRTIRKDVSGDLADQATDYVNYVLMRECNGYRHIRDAFSDALLLGNGPLKHWWDDTKEYTTESFSNLTEEQYQLVASDDAIEEIVEHASYPDPDWQMPPQVEQLVAAMESAGLPQDALPDAPMLHDLTIKRIVSHGRLKISALPPEEFLIERNAKVVDETCRFCAHVQRKTRSDLLKESYPRDKVDDLPAFQGADDFDEQDLRDDLSWNGADTAPDRATELVDVFECYVLVDYDGDGIAERRRVVVAGHFGERGILANEEWGDDLPFSDIVPEPRPHTWRGRGIYDEMADIQRVKTVCLRGILDNTYQVLYPQKAVVKDDVDQASWEEVVNPTWGGTIWLNNANPTAVTHLQIPHIGPQIAPVLEYMDQVGTRRTGVSDRMQALDPDALQNQTATAVNAAQAAVFAKTEEYARNIAEFGGMKRLFACALKLICKHQDRPKTIRLRSEYVEMDPRAWDADMDVTINVGLGTGSRERDLAMLQGVSAKQEMVIAQAGPLNEWVNIGHLFDTYRKMTEASGLKNSDQFFPDISQDEIARMRQKMDQAPKPPDPKILAAQAKLQMDQQRVTGDMQRKAMEMQADIMLQRQKTQAGMLAERERNAMEMEALRERNAMEIQSLRERTAAEIELERQEQSADFALRREEMAIEAELTREANMMGMMSNAMRPDTNIRGPQR